MRGVFDIRTFQPNHSTIPMVWDGARRSRTDHVAVGVLVFRCPDTDEDIESGIATDRDTFRKIQQFNVRLCCSSCDQFHEFEAFTGRLEPFRLRAPASSRRRDTKHHNA
jgi:hypothetical protein